MDPRVGVTIITMFDAAYVRSGLVENWLASLERVGLLDRVALYPLDTDALDHAQSTGCEVIDHFAGEPASDDSITRFSDEGFRALSLRKLEVVRHALTAGRAVLYSDADVVFLRDPLPRLARERAEIVLQSDCRPGVELSRPQWPWSHYTTRRGRFEGVICAGFMYLRPTPATLRLLDVERPDAPRFENDQFLLHDRIVWRREASFALLPESEFPNGAWYAQERWRRGAAALDDAYMLHANWCEGERKVELLKEVGLWCL